MRDFDIDGATASREQRAIASRVMSVVVIVGVVLFVTSFFLPALAPHALVYDANGSNGGNWVTLDDKATPGWFCARATITLIRSPNIYATFMGFATLSGLVNPLVVAFLLCGIVRKFAPARPYLAAAILLCLASTWVYLYHTALLVGHPMWVAGALLILSPEIASWRFVLGRDR